MTWRGSSDLVQLIAMFEMARPAYDAPHGHDGRDMRSSALMSENKTRRGDAVCVKSADAAYSSDALHEQLVEGIDDSDIRARTRAKLHAKGIPAAALNGLFPDLPPLSDE